MSLLFKEFLIHVYQCFKPVLFSEKCTKIMYNLLKKHELLTFKITSTHTWVHLNCIIVISIIYMGI